MTPVMLEPGSRRASAPMRGASFWILVCLVVLSPLPLGSARPIWADLMTVFVALGLLAYVVQRRRLRRPMPRLPGSLVIAGGLVCGVAVWAVVQATPGLVPAWAHPAWAIAGQALVEPDLEAAISVWPEQTRRVALHWFTYVGLGLLVALHSRRTANAELLLTVFVLTQGVYAVYGLGIHLTGLELVLWFDKTAYQGFLTSTFINRNSYATYVGLGLLAALAILLRHVRRIAQSDRSARAKALAMAERLWMRLLIPLTILSAGTVALLLTGSRMGLAAFCVAAVVFLAVWIGRLHGLARWLGAGLMAAILLVLGANFLLSGETTLARFDALFERGDGRFTVFPLILEAIADRPWLGHGLGSFETAFRLYRDETVLAFFDRGHSDWLELPMDVGLPAATLVVLAFAILAVRALASAWRAEEPERPLLAFAALLLVAVHATVDFSLQIPAVMVAFLLLLVAGLSAGSRSPAPAARQARPDTGARI